MDYNATTPLDPEVIKAISEALHDAWGNPSSTYTAGEKSQSNLSRCVFRGITGTPGWERLG